jgi:hypothetical protein
VSAGRGFPEVDYSGNPAAVGHALTVFYLWEIGPSLAPRERDTFRARCS